MLGLISRSLRLIAYGRTPREKIINAIGVVVILVVVTVVVSMQKRTQEAANAPPLRIEMATIAVGTEVHGQLTVGEEHVWQVSGTKGQRIAIELFTAWDSLLLLLMPDGIQTLTRDGFSGGNGRALIDGVTLPQDGIYRIVVSGENGEAGVYQLAIGVTDKPQQPAVLISR